MSVPSAVSHKPWATAEAEPDEEPPGTRSGARRIERRAVERVLAEDAERDLVGDGLADQRGAGVEQPLHRPGVARRDRMLSRPVRVAAAGRNARYSPWKHPTPPPPPPPTSPPPHRRDEQGQDLRDEQAADHRHAQRLAQLGAGAEADGDRQAPNSAAIVVIMIGRKRSRRLVDRLAAVAPFVLRARWRSRSS